MSSKISVLFTNQGTTGFTTLTAVGPILDEGVSAHNSVFNLLIFILTLNFQDDTNCGPLGPLQPEVQSSLSETDKKMVHIRVQGGETIGIGAFPVLDSPPNPPTPSSDDDGASGESPATATPNSLVEVVSTTSRSAARRARTSASALLSVPRPPPAADTRPLLTPLTSSSKPYDYLLKFLLVGDSDVGKQEILSTLENAASDMPFCVGPGEV